MNPTNTAKYGNTGDITFDTLDESLNIAPVNSGVKLDFIHNGITQGVNNDHFVAVDDIRVPDNINAIQEINISITNEKLPFLIKLNRIVVKTSPILENLNIAINSAAKNIINNNSPILFKDPFNILIKSLSELICFVIIPYIKPHTNAAIDIMINIPLTNGELAPNNLLTYKTCVLSSNLPDNGKLGIIE